MTTADLNIPAWCAKRAANYRNYEHVEMAMYPNADLRDDAIVEWTVRCLGNPLTAGSLDVLAAIASQHDAEINPTGTAAALAQSREQAATYANEIGSLKAELERMRAKLAERGLPDDANHWVNFNGVCEDDCPECAAIKASKAEATR